jgi:hypothetical protein
MIFHRAHEKSDGPEKGIVLSGVLGAIGWYMVLFIFWLVVELSNET